MDKKREHPSDILDYFISRKDIEAQGLMPAITQNYLDKHEAVNNTARALTEKGLSFIAAPDGLTATARFLFSFNEELPGNKDAV